MRAACIAILVVVAAYAAAPAAADPDPCFANAGARNSTEFASCVDHIKHETFSSDKIDALGACLKQTDRGFTGTQVQTIVALFTFSSDMITAIKMMQPYILGMTCDEIVAVLNTYSFSSDKITALQTMVDQRVIVDTKNSAEIIDAFTFSSDKDAARKILAGAKPRNCVYGNIIAKNVVFVVDTSGSMSATFSVDGTRYTRLQYVAKQLSDVITNQLTSTNNMNIVRFSSGSQQWQPGLVPVSASNAALAETFVNSWVADGGTNIYDALRTAYSYSNVEAVYLLSDGTPSVGQTNPNIIAEAAAGWSKEMTIPCHTIAFLEGSFSGDNKAASADMMSKLATATGGSYRMLTQ